MLNRIRAVSALLLVLVTCGTVAIVQHSGQLATVHTPIVTTTTTFGPVQSSVIVAPTCSPVPEIDLDPQLGASGPEVATLQTLLQLPQDGVYGTQTAQAVSQVQCPDLGLYAALQSLAEAAPMLTEQAQARHVAVPTIHIASNPSQACADAAAVINQVWAGTGQEDHALNVVQKESGCTDTAYNSSGASGLFQLLGHQDMIDAICGPGGSAFDPVCNAKVALQLYQGSGWAPWAASGG